MNIAGLFRNKAFLALVILTVLIGALGGLPQTLSAAVEKAAPETVDGITGRVTIKGGILGHGEAFSVFPGYGAKDVVVTAKVSNDGKGIRAVCSYMFAQYADGVFQQNVGIVNGANIVLRAGESADLQQVTVPVVMAEQSIRFELHVKVGSPPFGCQGKQARLGHDTARVVNGAGTIQLTDGQAATFQPGDKVAFDVSVGSGSWRVEVRDGNGGLMCGLTSGGFSLASILLTLGQFQGPVQPGEDADAFREQGVRKCESDKHTALSWTGAKSAKVFYTVPANAFKAGSADANLWQIELHNTQLTSPGIGPRVSMAYLPIGVPPSKTTTASQTTSAETPPSEPKVEVVRQAEAAVFSFTSGCNEETGADISHFRVDIWLGKASQAPPEGSAAWVEQGRIVPATKAGDCLFSGNFTVMTTDAGSIAWRAFAFDVEGAPSDDGHGDTGGDVGTQGHEPADSSTSAAMFGGLFILLLVGLGAFVLWYVLPLAPPIKVVIVVGGLLAVFLFGGSS